MSENISRRGLLIGGLGVLGLSIGGEAARQKVNNMSEDTGPDTAVEASGSFFRLQQEVFRELGPDSSLATPPGQLGKSFTVGDRRYSFYLDKEVEEMPNLPSYKRTMVIQDGDRRSEYFMIDESTLYEQINISEFSPLDLDQINGLTQEVRADFEHWRKG